MKKFLVFSILACLVIGLSAQSEVIISEYVEGWSNNKALELYNPTAYVVDLSEFRLIRYSNGVDVPPADDVWTVALPEFYLQPYSTFVIVVDLRDPDGTDYDAPVWSQLQQRADVFLCPEYEVSEAMYFNGDDAVVVEKDEGGGVFVIHDIFGRWGAPAPALAQFVNSDRIDNAWTNVAPYVTGEGVAITAEHTMIRKPGISTGISSNPALFNPLADWDTLPANTFDHLGWHNFDNAPANATPVVTNEKLTWAVSPSATNGAEIVTITATDAEQDALSFYMDGGNFIYIDDVRYEPFSLDKSTGVLSLVDETGLEPALKDTFDIVINITDGFSQVGPLNCKVIVTDNEVRVNSFQQSVLKAYPNPVNDNHFQIESGKGISTIYLTNLVGQVVLREEYSTPLKERNLNIDDDLKGVYLLKVVYEDRMSETLKLLIK